MVVVRPQVSDENGLLQDATQTGHNEVVVKKAIALRSFTDDSEPKTWTVTTESGVYKLSAKGQIENVSSFLP